MNILYDYDKTCWLGGTITFKGVLTHQFEIPRALSSHLFRMSTSPFSFFFTNYIRGHHLALENIMD